MSMAGRQLVVLGCSKVKVQASGGLPAIERYGGSAYHVLRSYLRDSLWPQ